MPSECPSYLRADVMRVTRLNACGQPVYGDESQCITDGFVTVSMKAEVEDGEEVTVTKANGKVCVSDKSPDQWKWQEVELEFCQVDPALIQIMNPTWELIRDNQGDVVGFDAIGDLSTDTGFALELWLDVYGGSSACTGQANAQGRWGYMLLPWVVGAAPGDLEIEAGEGVTFPFVGRTKLGSGWRKGPYPVTLDENGVPGPLLKPVTSKTHYQLFETVIRPPEPECGAQPLDRPTPEPADLMVTGLPSEDPRRTVRLWPDNHGFGPVLIDWGDGTTDEETIEGRWVPHTYGSDRDYTITVRDKQTPAVKARKKVTIPLPADEPTIKLSCGGDEKNPLKVKAKITMPPHSDGKGSIDWGDGSDREDFDTSSASGGIANLAHTYMAPSIYTAIVRRKEQNKFRGRDAIQVPCEGDGSDGKPKACAEADKADATGRTVSLTLGKDCDEDDGPEVKVKPDKADDSGRTAVITITDDEDETPTPASKSMQG